MPMTRYFVQAIRAVDGEPAPPEIRERFEGRLFSLHELEQRGVRIAGRHVWFMANARDWQLTLAPAT
jgi:hypothetical protein